MKVLIPEDFEDVGIFEPDIQTQSDMQPPSNRTISMITLERGNQSSDRVQPSPKVSSASRDVTSGCFTLAQTHSSSMQGADLNTTTSPTGPNVQIRITFGAGALVDLKWLLLGVTKKTGGAAL